MKFNILILLVSVLTISACSDSDSEQNATGTTEAAQQSYLPDLPAMTNEDFNFFVVNCTSIDYIMSRPDFSMSVNGQSDVRNDLGGISQNPVRRPSTCQPIGMVFYKTGADRMFEADLFADANCQYIVFKKDNKELYANALYPEGYQRFVNVLKQIQGMNQGQ